MKREEEERGAEHCPQYGGPSYLLIPGKSSNSIKGKERRGITPVSREPAGMRGVFSSITEGKGVNFVCHSKRNRS